MTLLARYTTTLALPIDCELVCFVSTGQCDSELSYCTGHVILYVTIGDRPIMLHLSDQ